MGFKVMGFKKMLRVVGISATVGNKPACEKRLSNQPERESHTEMFLQSLEN